jgi:hypothetical protein
MTRALIGSTDFAIVLPHGRKLWKPPFNTSSPTCW